MGAMAAQDRAAIFMLYNEFGAPIAAIMRRELRRMGVERVDADALDGLVIDASMGPVRRAVLAAGLDRPVGFMTGMRRRPAVEESQARHPTAWRPDVGRMRMRMAEELAVLGALHPEVGASALAVRGSLGLDRPCFA